MLSPRRKGALRSGDVHPSVTVHLFVRSFVTSHTYIVAAYRL